VWITNANTWQTTLKMKLLYAFTLCILAQVVTFIQLQGQSLWKFPKENPYIMALLGVPISLLFMKYTRILNGHFEANWPGRIIGFGVGIIIFTVMSWLMFKEVPTTKTLICLGLAFSIVLIQMFWK
jgi:hypothetical protein